MRAVDCWCGQVLQGEDDEDLADRLHEHVSEEHADDAHSDEDIHARIAERAYEPPSGDPPWAY